MGNGPSNPGRVWITLSVDAEDAGRLFDALARSNLHGAPSAVSSTVGVEASAIGGAGVGPPTDAAVPRAAGFSRSALAMVAALFAVLAALTATLAIEVLRSPSRSAEDARSAAIHEHRPAATVDAGAGIAAAVDDPKLGASPSPIGMRVETKGAASSLPSENEPVALAAARKGSVLRENRASWTRAAARSTMRATPPISPDATDGGAEPVRPRSTPMPVDVPGFDGEVIRAL